jgi:hypothetical protein
MEITSVKSRKVTLIPLARVGYELNLNAPFQISERLTFENVEGLITPELLSLWKDEISKRELDNLSSVRFAILHHFNSPGHLGREEADSSDYSFKVFLCLRVIKPTKAVFEPMQLKLADKGLPDVFSIAHQTLWPNSPESEALNSYDLKDMTKLRQLLPAFMQLASEGPENVRRAVRFFNAGYDEVRDPILQIVVWTMGIEALLSQSHESGEKQFIDAIARTVGAETDIYAGSPIREYVGNRRFSVGSLVGDLFNLRNLLVHGQWIPSEWKSRPGRDSLAGSPTNYADVLREAATFILRNGILKHLEKRSLDLPQSKP